MPLDPKQQPPYYTATGTIKTYQALIEQEDTDPPIATEIQNTIGNIIWTRESTGLYRATLASTFTANKTLIQATIHRNGDAICLQANRANDNFIYVMTIDGDYANQDNNSWTITIQIYP